MNYKETLFFIGKCLTINHEEHNKIIIEKILKNENVDWDSVVKVSTSHYVFPALYCNFKKANFLNYLPKDLVEYMKHITDLNRERNQQIIEQAKEINQLLLKNNITPIFLKGTGNLLEGLYDDIAERMVGDIDFLVSKNDYNKTINLLLKDDYIKENTSYDDMTFHWHFPPLSKEGKITYVEVHKDILKNSYTFLLNFDIIKKQMIQINNFYFESPKHQYLNALLPKIINDNLYNAKSFSLRTMYDVFLLFCKNQNMNSSIENNKFSKKLNNVLACIQLTLNSNSIQEKVLIPNHIYTKSYLKSLDNSKSEKIKLLFINSYNLNKDRVNIIIKSLQDKEFRTYAKKRLTSVDFYKRFLGFKPNS